MTNLGLPDPVHCAGLMLRAFADPGAWCLYPDVLPTLDALTAMGHRLGVVSNWTVALQAMHSPAGGSATCVN